MENDTNEKVLDFQNLSEGPAEEGAKLKGLLLKMLGIDAYFRMFPVPTSLRGTRRQISAFTDAAREEKKYLKAVKKSGLNDPHVLRSKLKLKSAIRQFEKLTGMTWPIK